ncbi:MAG: DUF2341 domain-containing protein, partial [Candidatus Aenigmatarchaeota archaeon]
MFGFNITNVGVISAGRIIATSFCIGNDCISSWSQIRSDSISPWSNNSIWIFIRDGYPLNVNISNILFVNATTGNVGIGTTNPQARLDVAGNIRIGQSSTVCNENHRGELRFERGTGGEDDKLYICMRDSNGNYRWILVARGDSWLSGWQYRIPITITERSGNTLTDYQVLVLINTQNLISQGKMRNDCGDIRFTDSDGITLLNYWIEPNTCNTENTRIWVKVPYIPANSQKTIYLYYGNPEATSLSNGTATFIAFDWKFDGPISAGYSHTCALLSNGSIMCWGDNWAGQLGLGYTSDPIPYPQQVIGIDNAIAISSGDYHTCALLSNGSIMCWGDNWAGQLGLGYTSGYEPTP